MTIKFLINANINPNILQDLGWQYIKGYKNNKETNFGLVVHAYLRQSKLLIIIRGTDSEEITDFFKDLKSISPLNDIINDIALILGLLPDQLTPLRKFYKQIYIEHPEITSTIFTGHSLGGALAQLMALSVKNAKAFAFDSPGVAKVAQNYGLMNKPNDVFIFNNAPNLINSYGKHLVQPWQITSKIPAVYSPNLMNFIRYSLESHKLKYFASSAIAIKPNYWPQDSILPLKINSYNNYLSYAKHKNYWDRFINGEDFAENIINKGGNILIDMLFNEADIGDLLMDVGDLALDSFSAAQYDSYDSREEILSELHDTSEKSVQNYAAAEKEMAIMSLDYDVHMG